MNITSKEVVKRAINFNTPPRLPCRFPECNEVDFCDIRVLDDRGRNFLGKEQYTKDEWECIWKTELQGSMGEVVNAIIDDWSKLSKYKTPNPNDSSRYKNFDKELKKRKDKYVLVYNHFFLFERMHFLVGFTKLLESFYLNYKEVEKLADMIVDFQVGIIRNLSKRYKGYIDGMWTTDDWGTQTALFINKDMWIDIFKPRYKIIANEFHEAGIDWWFHSCGKINSIIDQLIDIGVKVINTYQPTCMGIEEIGEKFRGKICFETSIDIQNTIFKEKEDIRKEAFSIVNNWSTKKGGLVATNYNDVSYDLYRERGNPIEINKLMYKYFNEAYDKYYKKIC